MQLQLKEHDVWSIINKFPAVRRLTEVFAVAEQKTNVMRILDQRKSNYKAYEYAHGEGAVDGATVAKLTGLDPAKVFKTLVTRGAGGNIYVFDIPVTAELDLKKAAKAVGEKSVAMIHVSEINAVTGYVRGGCSPIGMKKQYATVIDSSCETLDSIVVSAGKIGYQVELPPAELIKLVRAKTADIVCD